tara:strand:+ start:6546 stop:7880 length:1335 start_codon:yes stop_codon:yes gene_type:complete
MKCRFAPSPTGLLHVGNIRSALLNWIITRKNKGRFLLRLDDTDLLRSSKEFEKKIKEDLSWLGINWDKTFNQSERSDIYEKQIDKLKTLKRLYPCFETNEELSLKKKSLLSSGKPPIYDRFALNYSESEINDKLKKGLKPHWRFKLEEKPIVWNDLIKGEVKFDSKKLSDPILIREDGSLLYHLPSVIDDIEENISHIIRGEDHISNTAFHIQIFEALNSNVPTFAHHPFLTDKDGKGFGKRINSLSIENLRSEGFEEITILNYLLNIGSSKDIKPELSIENIKNNFEIKNISNSSAKFSYEILKSLNGDVLKKYEYKDVSDKLKAIINYKDLEKFWLFVKNNIQFITEVETWFECINSVDHLKDFNISNDFIDTAIKTIPNEPYDYNTWERWVTSISEISGLKGKDLFMPLRLILTGKDKGPELKNLLPLLDRQIILRKFGKI